MNDEIVQMSEKETIIMDKLFNILVAFYILQWQWTLDRMQQVVVGTLLRNFTVYFACQPG